MFSATECKCSEWVPMTNKGVDHRGKPLGGKKKKKKIPGHRIPAYENGPAKREVVSLKRCAEEQEALVVGFFGVSLFFCKCFLGGPA